MGRPSVFIRAALCNLHCRWCDTDYTWNWDDTSFAHDRDVDPGYRKYKREEQILSLPVSELADVALQYPCRNYVFTGGEPLVQEKAWVELMRILDEAVPARPWFEVESNGTLLPSVDFLERVDQLNISPKLANSGMTRETRLHPEVLRVLVATGKADFKFVVGSEEDLAEICDLVEEVSMPADRVFLMPLASTVAALEETQLRVSNWALEKGFRYSDRLHLRLYGAKRGT